MTTDRLARRLVEQRRDGPDRRPQPAADGTVGRVGVSVVGRRSALVHLALGEKDQAMKWLESSFAKHQPDLNWIRVDPDLRALHGDPRFEALAERIVPAHEFAGVAAAKK